MPGDSGLPESIIVGLVGLVVALLGLPEKNMVELSGLEAIEPLVKPPLTPAPLIIVDADCVILPA